MAPRFIAPPRDSFLDRKALVTRAFDTQDLQQQREGRLEDRDAFNNAFKQAQLESRASSAEDRASALRDQNETMNQIRQQTADLEQKRKEVQDQQSLSDIKKQAIDFDRQGRAERDGAGYLDAVSKLDPSSKTYRKDVNSALRDYPLALETKSALEHFTQAAEDSRKYTDQDFHTANIIKEEQAKIDAQKGVANVERINEPLLDPITQKPKTDKNGNVIMTTKTSVKSVEDAPVPPLNPVASPLIPVSPPVAVPQPSPTPGSPVVQINGTTAQPTIAPAPVNIGNATIANPDAQPASNPIPIQHNSEAAIAQRYFGK